MASKMDYLEQKTKQIMMDEFNVLKTQVPWDGMLDEGAKKIVMMIKKEISDAQKKMVKPTLHEMQGKNPEQFMKVLCELGVNGKEEWVEVPLQYDWSPSLEQCASLLSVYLEKPRS